MCLFRQSAALTAAAGSWWSELQKVGVNANLTLVGDEYLKIGHWSQMAWAATAKLGCGVQWCETKGDESLGDWSKFTYVVCNYSPAGNSHEPIYEPGPPCSKCGSGTGNDQNACSGSLCNGAQ
ncbi:venom allergen-like protein vap-2 [Aphelenchoides avenae]|nr:venom allergen-like protein vap-2 [Aphelenchus avenae]